MKEQTKTRKLKVYNQSRGNYSNIPTIILKGHWLKEFGFLIDSTIIIKCNKNELIIKNKKIHKNEDILLNILKLYAILIMRS